jgi:hypothetical protein
MAYGPPSTCCLGGLHEPIVLSPPTYGASCMQTFIAGSEWRDYWLGLEDIPVCGRGVGGVRGLLTVGCGFVQGQAPCTSGMLPVGRT